MTKVENPAEAPEDVAAYIADMLSQLADMARLNGQIALAVAIRTAALQALLDEPDPAAASSIAGTARQA